MSVRRAPYNIHAAMIRETAEHLRDTLAMLEDGKITGVAIAAWASDRRNHVLGVSGYMRKNIRDAYWLTGRLNHQILLMDPN